MTETYRVLISATSEAEADRILDSLTEKRIIAGGLVTNGKSKYWWDGKIEQKIYFNISTFTQASKKDDLITEVKRIHSDKTPIIAFFKIEYGNDEFLDWVVTSTL